MYGRRFRVYLKDGRSFEINASAAQDAKSAARWFAETRYDNAEIDRLVFLRWDYA